MKSAETTHPEKERGKPREAATRRFPGLAETDRPEHRPGEAKTSDRDEHPPEHLTATYWG